MRGTLVRIGIDQAYGGWNAPVDPATNEFVYVPIPEGKQVPQHPELATTYASVELALRKFAATRPGVPRALVTLPANFGGAATHLDPDFEQLTYGDNGERRGRAIASFDPGDLVVFYAGLRPVATCADRLVYALVGVYRVASVAGVADFPRSRWHENAHLRRARARPTDVVVHGDPVASGRLRRWIPIGEFRDGAYRVRRDLLESWGGLSCKDGFIQRSAVPPRFKEPARFLSWFDRTGAELVASNGEGGSMTYWVCKLTYDTGTAPHVRDGLLSLAICKPRIREGAVVGDVLFGFGGRSRKVNRGERLIYVAEVTEKLAIPGEYYGRPEFRHRLDCIYEWKGERLVWRVGSLTHEDEKSRANDLGPAPRYPRAIVLLSDKFRYLGAEGSMDYAGLWPNLATFVHETGIGERQVEPESEMGRFLTELKRQLWRARPASKVGAPTEPPSRQPAWGTSAQGTGSSGAAASCSPSARPPAPPPRPKGRCG